MLIVGKWSAFKTCLIEITYSVHYHCQRRRLADARQKVKIIRKRLERVRPTHVVDGESIAGAESYRAAERDRNGRGEAKTTWGERKKSC
jgi:hypothetical protein